MKTTLFKILLPTFLIVFAIIWAVLTFYVQKESVVNTLTINPDYKYRTALIVYNPDPFYNLDEQVCNAFAKGLANENWQVTVATTKAINENKIDTIDLLVVCANTYNWAPDKAIVNFIQSYPQIKNKNVVALCLGSGATERAKRLLEKQITERKGNLIDSKEYWLMKPNNDSINNKSNIEIAIDMAHEHGLKIAKKLNSHEKTYKN